MSENSISCMLTSSQKRKMSQSYKKVGKVCSKLPCKKDDYFRVVLRGIDSTNHIEELLKLYAESTKNKKEHLKNTPENEFGKVLHKRFSAPNRLLSTAGIPLCYLDDMPIKTIETLNKITEMNKSVFGKADKVIAALEKTKERFFEKDDTNANWARLLGIWIFERDEETEYNLKCILENHFLEDFMKHKAHVEQVPHFTNCGTEDLGEWSVYEIDKNDWQGRPLLTVKDPLYIEDIMRRKPYQFARRQIIQAIEKIPLDDRTEKKVKETIAKLMEIKIDNRNIASFSYTGPMSATDEYCVLEWFLGSYITNIICKSYNENTGEVTLTVITENESHWESAVRYPGVMKQVGFSDYMFADSYRENDDRAFQDLAKMKELELYMKPSNYFSPEDLAMGVVYGVLGGAATAYYNKDDNATEADDDFVKGGAVVGGGYMARRQMDYMHYYYGGNYVQRFEGEDSFFIATKTKFSLIEIIYFEFDEKKITMSWEKQKLETIISLLKESDLKLELTLIGHTDAVGSEIYNEGLGYDRAESVANYLGQSISLYDADIKSYGEYNLVYETEKKCRLNRRVEIILSEVE